MERNTAWPVNFVESNRIKGMGMLKRRMHACKAHSRFGANKTPCSATHAKNFLNR
jgi:hypothetical protein